MWKKVLGFGAILYAADRLSQEIDVEEIKEKFEAPPKETYVLETAQDISDLVNEVLEENSPHVKSAKPGIVYFSSMHQCRRSSGPSGFIISSKPDGYEVKFIKDCVEGPGYLVIKKESFHPDDGNAEDRSDFELIDEVYWEFLK